jgi:uncharacterized caspase-like protein
MTAHVLVEWGPTGASRRLSRRLLAATIVLVGAVLWPAIQDVAAQEATGEASPRFALVVGNGAYRRMGALRNPPNDAERIAEALRDTGFLVTTVIDADRRMMLQEIRALAQNLTRSGGVGLFFYAGHAVQVDGENYLIPVGADIVTETDVEFEAVALAAILAHMEDSENELNMLMLDSCRDNPFSSVPDTRGLSGTRGLSVVSSVPQGSVVMYATSPNQTATDGDGQNSPFAEAIVNNIRTPGQNLNTFLDRAGADVMQATGGEQTPHISKLFFGEFSFVPTAASLRTVARRPAY